MADSPSVSLAGKLRLVPESALLDALRQDYQAMLAAQMFYGETLAFDRIVERLAALEQQINQEGSLSLAGCSLYIPEGFIAWRAF